MKSVKFQTGAIKNPSMFVGFANEDSVWGRDESVEVFDEMVLIEVLETLVLVFTVVGEAIYSGLSSFIFGVALVDEGDSVLQRKVVDRRYTVELLVHNGKSFL